MQCLRIGCFLFFLWTLQCETQNLMPKNSLPCDDRNRCLQSGSRECWKRFYNEESQKDAIMADILKPFSEANFLYFVDEAEGEMLPEFLGVDKNLTDCMSTKGYRPYLDFCTTVRSKKFIAEMEKTVESKKSQRQFDEETGRRRVDRRSADKNCWITTLKTCSDQYKTSTELVEKALEQCERDASVVDSEKRIGFEVGKRVILKIVSK